jgi:hypothetical protein
MLNESVEDLPRDVVRSAERIYDRAEQQCRNAEYQVHKTGGLCLAAVMVRGLWLEYKNEY